jgi:betaine-aldehyde dehydrogenase
VPAGKAVLRSAAETLKRTLLELGGKNAMVVYPDADLARAADGAIRGMNFTWCGQSCGSTSRLLVHESVHDQLISAMVPKLRAAHQPGIATHMATTMGALVSQAQFDKSMSYIESARSEGAELVTGGGRPADERLARGNFIEPTVFIGVRPDMRVAKEEIFGPVLSVIRWRDEGEMLDIVNGVEFGLTASIWTQNLVTAHRMAASVEAGYVWINDCSSHFIGAPFGGCKQSGLGREESKDELLEFTHTKNVNVSLT